MKFVRHIIIVCLVATFSANAGEQVTADGKCAANQPTNAELQLLQGRWESFSLSQEKPDGPPVKETNTITVTITGNSLHFHRDTNFWWKTTITLPADTNPRQLHATITDCPDCSPKKENLAGTVVVAIYKIEDGIQKAIGSSKQSESEILFLSTWSQALSLPSALQARV